MSWNRVSGELLGRERPEIGPDERRFLDAIIATPADDAPRAVYADWLQERGEPRGELITLELVLAREADVDAHNRLKQRDFALLEEHGHRWCAAAGLGGVAHAWRPVDWYVEFTRGFIERVDLRGSLLAPTATFLFGREPVRELHLSGTVERLHDMIHLRRLHTLVLRGNALGDVGVARLAASPHVAGLHHLAIHANDVTDAGAHALADSPYLQQLRVLALGGNQIGNAGARELVGLANLVSLDLANNPVDDATFFALRRRYGDAITR